MIVEGWASHISMDHVRDVVMPSAFNDSIQRKGLTGPKSIKFQFHHERDKIIGRITKLEPRNEGLWLEGWINEALDQGAVAAETIRTVEGLSMSIGYRLLDVDLDVDDNGDEFFRILRAELIEVSIVPEPCNSEAIITAYREDEK